MTTNTENRLMLRDADGYDAARFARVFNLRRPDRFPAAVLFAESEDDVTEGVRLARDRGWTVAIRAGGHSFPAWSLRDDGLVIDLGGFKEISLDENTDVVSITPSVSGGELNAYLSGSGRFLPEPFRLALVAVDIAGLSYREAAEALDAKEATITTRLHRARQRVARELAP
jgi:FAD/FMN-containing dehydrogenase